MRFDVKNVQIGQKLTELWIFAFWLGLIDWRARTTTTMGARYARARTWTWTRTTTASAWPRGGGEEEKKKTTKIGSLRTLVATHQGQKAPWIRL